MRFLSTPKHPDRRKQCLESFEAVMNVGLCLKAYRARVSLSLLVVTKVFERIQHLDLSVSRRGVPIAV